MFFCTKVEIVRVFPCGSMCRILHILHIVHTVFTPLRKGTATSFRQTAATSKKRFVSPHARLSDWIFVLMLPSPS